MSKNTRWSTDDFKRAGLIEVGGHFVKASSQVAKGKVDKMPNLLERAIPLVEAEDIGTIGIGEVFGNHQVKDVNRHKNGALSLTMGPFGGYANDVVKAERERAANHERPHIVWDYGIYFMLPNMERVTIEYRFDIAPCAAPRMTRRDKYYLDPNHPDQKKRQRKVVTKYFGWKTAFTLMAKQQGYALTEVLRVIFIVPMPAGLSEKEKDARRGEKHQIRPDTDNYTKAIKDSFGVDDGFVWDERSIKVWGDVGQIIIF